jgi:hypothetical protein
MTSTSRMLVTEERDAAYRAYVERASSAWKDAPPTSPLELLLVQHQPDPGREIASRPKHRRIRRRRHDRGRPQNRRRTELAGMRRDELGDDGTFVIPSSRTKNKRPHVVPLPLARTIIASVNPVASPVGWVFTNSVNRRLAAGR